MENPNRLEILITQYENTLYRTALAILGSPAEAEDAVQDTFLCWLEKRPNFNDAEHEKAWLLQVTVNGCKSRLRQQKRRPTVELLDIYPAQTEGERIALEAVRLLPEKERTVVHLFYYEGYSTEEIAGLTGQRPGTVRSHLSRARARLRELLKGEEL
jgi:RNA polymerase sigma-70 factor (ECF subfamily)